MSKTLLIATHNRGKVKEIARMLAAEAVEFLTLADLDIDHDVEETAPDFLGNARLKAEAYARMSGYLTLADDSGLEVDALGGAPGVHTKRYGGAELDDEGRYRHLLANLAAVPTGERGARFRCVMVLAGPDGAELGWAEGVCEGRIAGEPAGANGFGYDPVFYLPELDRTMAQLTGAEKNERSHRGRALAAIAPLLKEQLAG
ncbi:MAG: RdgB/HAM1 family non-canonical purine NTP pyrophosphatase [Anaerolineales bacterium]|nr:RdgB/HAM1 family non-canonical purine NTP pyrophosphatase [Anaerolineales bacterium]